MINRPYATLVLPAYNEVERISGTLAEARSYFDARRYEYEIIVAADGDDGTRELASKFGQGDSRIKVIGTLERRGKGIGIREAVAQAKGTIVGFADADNKTPIEEFDKFIPLLNGHCDIAIGSRAAPESRIERRQPFYRRGGSRVFAMLMHAIVGLDEIKDTQCGFKLFRREVALDLFSRQRIDGYMFDVEVLYLAGQAGYRIEQVPVRWKDDGDSRLQLFRGNVRNAIDLLKIPLLHGKAGHPADLGDPTSKSPRC
jgi:dolichyl-phosphate beta-glucosyltransferase